MARVTKSRGDDGRNFEEITTGETPNSVELTINAKGQAQVGIKCYFSDPVEMKLHAAEVADAVLESITSMLAKRNIPLAGQGA